MGVEGARSLPARNTIAFFVALVVDLNSPHRYVQPAPVYVQHQQIPLQAHTVYTPPQAVRFGHDRDRFDRDHGDDRFDRRGGPLADADRDGIPNMLTAIRASTRQLRPGGEIRAVATDLTRSR